MNLYCPVTVLLQNVVVWHKKNVSVPLSTTTQFCALRVTAVDLYDRSGKPCSNMGHENALEFCCVSIVVGGGVGASFSFINDSLKDRDNFAVAFLVVAGRRNAVAGVGEI